MRHMNTNHSFDKSSPGSKIKGQIPHIQSTIESSLPIPCFTLLIIIIMNLSYLFI